jgi:hypothetical protein
MAPCSESESSASEAIMANWCLLSSPTFGSEIDSKCHQVISDRRVSQRQRLATIGDIVLQAAVLRLDSGARDFHILHNVGNVNTQTEGCFNII